jgi:hypothetical protein
MGYEVNFAELKARVSILDVLAMLNVTGLEPHVAKKRDGTEVPQLRGRCPIHNGNHPREFVVTPSLNAFYCHGTDCNSGGDVIELVARMKGFTEKNRSRLAAEAIAANFSGAAKPAPKAETSEGQRKRFDPAAYQKTLQPDHVALTPLGISADTIRAFGGGFCTKPGLLVGRLALPLTDSDGTITAFMGIGLPAPHDLKFPERHPDYFGHIGEGVVTLVKHPLAVLRAYEAGIENTLCVLKPLSWQVLTTLAELLKEKNCECIELF